MTISRRSLIAASVAMPFAASAARAAARVSIRLDPQHRLGAIPSDFMGLGYEISSVAVPGLLSAANHAYVRLVRNLGRQGVIRIGGNTSDFSVFRAEGPSVSSPKASMFSTEDLRQLRGFLDAIGWKLIWGLNLGADDLENTLQEARAVADIMGPRLLALQIGNEPDLFVNSGHRHAPYDYAAWHADYRRTKDAIRASLPHAPFAGPDTAGGMKWVTPFALDEGGDLMLLTAHHYIGGQGDPKSTIALMLEQEKNYQQTLVQFQAATRQAGLPYRITETNSFYGGGKAGVSDTFASALWVLDYLFVLASFGCAGVNMETGVNHLGWISHYTPISDDLAGHYGAAPEYYGLLALAQVAEGEQIAVACDAAGINLTTYGVRHASGRISLAVINKDASQDGTVEIAADQAFTDARVMRLTAPSLSASDGIMLGGAGLDANGRWSGGRTEKVSLRDGKAALDVSAGSAALITLAGAG